MPYDVAGFEVVTKPLTVADVLNRAADLIELNGWWNGDGHFPSGLSEPLCAGLAIEFQIIPNWLKVNAAKTLRNHVGITDSGPAGYVGTWNDAQPDGATVCRALRAAASAS